MTLNQHIEEKRKELLHTAKSFGFQSRETLRCSKELDDLIINVQHSLSTPLFANQK
ncbi:aspartyl-phosphate phosphatase Spo0E family protein [Alteribacter populi]|uniref:aspartyl-phosphate phosphatase Spo0E family protein n=1 Tax=Alteribacter populi TaxID=2011011 RepID=UPI000BBA64D2|nr:aspartyl-phosphate phosphatase Spo0E family protein [Alteribacter populi]